MNYSDNYLIVQKNILFWFNDVSRASSHQFLVIK